MTRKFEDKLALITGSSRHAGRVLQLPSESGVGNYVTVSCPTRRCRS